MCPFIPFKTPYACATATVIGTGLSNPVPALASLHDPLLQRSLLDGSRPESTPCHPHPTYRPCAGVECAGDLCGCGGCAVFVVEVAGSSQHPPASLLKQLPIQSALATSSRIENESQGPRTRTNDIRSYNQDDDQAPPS